MQREQTTDLNPCVRATGALPFAFALSIGMLANDFFSSLLPEDPYENPDQNLAVAALGNLAIAGFAAGLTRAIQTICRQEDPSITPPVLSSSVAFLGFTITMAINANSDENSPATNAFINYLAEAGAGIAASGVAALGYWRINSIAEAFREEMARSLGNGAPLVRAGASRDLLAAEREEERRGGGNNEQGPGIV